MTTLAVPLRVTAASFALATTALLLTACSPVLGGSGFDRDSAASNVDLPAGVPDDASDFDFLAQGSTTYVSWKGGAVEGASCVSDGSTIPDLPGAVERGTTVSGTVEQCDFGHQLTSGGHTYIWMSK